MTGTWERHSTATLLRRSRLAVHTDQATTPGGDQVAYDWVETADLVRVAAVAHGEVWIADQHHYLPGRRMWQLPGGAVDAGETPAAAAARELAEETGLSAAQWTSAGATWPLPGVTTARVHLWIATGLRVGTARPERSEADLAVQAVPLPEARKAVMDGRVGCAASSQLLLTVCDGIAAATATGAAAAGQGAR